MRFIEQQLIWEQNTFFLDEYDYLVNRWWRTPSGMFVFVWGIAMVGQAAAENVRIYLRTSEGDEFEIAPADTTFSAVATTPVLLTSDGVNRIAATVFAIRPFEVYVNLNDYPTEWYWLEKKHIAQYVYPQQVVRYA